MIECARQGCGVKFAKRTHNQKYHDAECCRLATNARIMEDYYESKAIRNNKERYCSKCKETRLSRYNSSKMCNSCQQKKEQSMNNSVLSMLMSSQLRFDLPA